MPEDQVDDIVVTGQRRKRNTDNFPSQEEATTPTPPVPGDVATLPGDDPREGETPCSNPDFRERWDADAEAATAIPEFLSEAATVGDIDENGQPYLGNREFGATLLNNGGSFTLGPVVHEGPVQQGHVPSVTMNYTGATASKYRGDIHFHPSGDPRPSGQDWISFRNILTQNPTIDASQVYMYIVVRNPSGGPPPYQIYVYGTEDDPQEGGDPNAVGDEVNPEGQPCPI